LQLTERYSWIPSLNAEYLVGVDGLSLMLVLLVSIIFPFALLAQPASKGQCALMLVMQSALYGNFTAQNFILWFFFYELSLIPSFLLIKVWGGNGRNYAAWKFFLYTFIGSVAMLLGFLLVYNNKGTFDFAALTQMAQAKPLQEPIAWLAFAGIFLGLAVKVPIFPFHTWLPDTYAAAPTGVTMALTGALSKMGVYGFIRLLLPTFPAQAHRLAPWLLTLAVISILVGSLAAWMQRDLKRLVAYLSINHLGYCMLAVFAVTFTTSVATDDRQAALGGAFAQIFNHGLTAATFFYWVGLLEQRRGRRGVEDFGGLMQRAPLFCGWMSITIFSSLGLPGLNSFISEFLIFKGSFALATTYTCLSVAGLLFVAITLLLMMQRLFS
jgi:NADH-quinone oxidoreductase subunit M